MNSVGLFLMLGQRFFSFFVGERSSWSRGSEAAGAGGAEQLEQGEQSD
jgi:hypothetical protein